MNDPANTDAIAVHEPGFHAALEALAMDDPHPKGYRAGTVAHRLSRALWAYEWARREHPRYIPQPGTARRAVLNWEARPEEE